MLKSQNELDNMELSDIYQVKIIDKYANRLDSLESMCLAGFGTTFIGKNSVEVSAGFDDKKLHHFSVCS